MCYNEIIMATFLECYLQTIVLSITVPIIFFGVVIMGWLAMVTATNGWVKETGDVRTRSAKARDLCCKGVLIQEISKNKSLMRCWA